MEPIISPWVFYAAEVANGVKVFLIISPLFLSLAVMLYSLFLVDCAGGVPPGFGRKAAKALATAFAIEWSLAVFVPSEPTIYKMMAAQLVTSDNIRAVQGNLVDFIGQVAKELEGVKNE